ncbi:transcriptional regulator [Providencia rettgeri]|uniref:helix-turn-helix domain-containing protein n=1 Tax=Providencia rettgeri TaxID=587 RepID=UPI003015D152
MSISIGKKIRAIRDSEMLTREQFADLTGIPAGTQKYYETGRVDSIASDTLLKITSHPQFSKYTLWLMSDLTNEIAGQIAPALSPDGLESIQNLLKVSNAGK